MKVLHLIPSLERGGAERSLVNLSSSDEEADHVIVALLSGSGALRQELPPPVRYYGHSGSRPAQLARSIATIIRLVRTGDVDVIHCWMYLSMAVGSLVAMSSRRDRRPRIVWGVRHGEVDRTLSRFSRSILWFLRVAPIRRPDGIIYVSHRSRAAHRPWLARAPVEEVIWNGVSRSYLNYVREADDRPGGVVTGEGVRTFVAVGRNHPQKGFVRLIEAFARTNLPGAQLWIMGKGVPNLRGVVPPGSRIELFGEVPDVRPFLARADSVVLASVDGEGFPNAVAEGMAMGAVPIVTDTGDACRMIGSSGRCVPRFDSEGLCRALGWLAELPQQELERLSREAHHRAASFSVPTMVANYRAVYERVLSLDAVERSRAVLDHEE